ncbi:hypothetical protein PIB30_017294 [Stylosanthes scabra]|uniref:Uncharacterized protein n=1 Tax=Stylosanthes scabra TaxID=79078 RepID=A0ABU6R811_9FABA|nr:hypothetical protein [Stylosanthes scabra]
MPPKLNPRRSSSQVNNENKNITNEGEIETVKAKWEYWNTEIFFTICVKEIQINSEFAKFKNECPKVLGSLEQCFKDIVATGYGTWAPSEVQNLEKINNQNNYDDTNEDFENGDDINYTNEFVQEDIADITIVQSPPKKKRRKTSSKKVEKRFGIDSRLQNSLDRMLVSMESKAAAKGDDPCSIENCIKLLRTLSGLEPSSP